MIKLSLQLTGEWYGCMIDERAGGGYTTEIVRLQKKKLIRKAFGKDADLDRLIIEVDDKFHIDKVEEVS